MVGGFSPLKIDRNFRANIRKLELLKIACAHKERGRRSVGPQKMRWKDEF